MNITSNCDVTNNSHQIQINDHHMPLNESSPMKIFCVRHCRRTCWRWIPSLSDWRAYHVYSRETMHTADKWLRICNKL